MCTTEWYKHFNLEFNAFSVNNFSKVMFIMDDAYTNIIQDGFYKCIFFKFSKTFYFILKYIMKYNFIIVKYFM